MIAGGFIIPTSSLIPDARFTNPVGRLCQRGAVTAVWQTGSPSSLSTYRNKYANPKRYPISARYPPYLYLTGFISAFIVLSITFLIPILGARKLVNLSLAGQILMAMIVSHLGILESPHDPITLKKLFGASLFITGAIVSVS
jgi:uncharacterized membrane protein YdcZ (DUF606 family)